MTPRHIYQKLYGVRDRYQGTRPPAIAEPREPVRVVSMRRSGQCVLLAIAEGAEVTYLRIASFDDPRLQVLGADDRSQIHSALMTMAREVGDAA